MNKAMRVTTLEERRELMAKCCQADDWSQVLVSEEFDTSQFQECRFSGRVIVGRGAKIFNSHIANYSIGEDSLIDSVALLECSPNSRFGNGVQVSSINECGGRELTIYESLTSQIAYMTSIYRHSYRFITRMNQMALEVAAMNESSIGSVGSNVKIIGAKIIRDVKIGDSVVVEGTSLLSNGTILDNSYFGVDVKARDFIAAQGSKVDLGSSIERCFVGECVTISSHFSAVDSLFFALSHLENGEAVSVFGGPYTVSHHKSTLLIAGMFSFFNAGSGSNQSNHLFKCGPVHQGVHLRGCKFGSGAYIMLPALDGAYTSVFGSHKMHHNTSAFPFSYLIVRDGRSALVPAANLASYGYVRDVEKWVARDRREVKRDVVNLEEHNPYIGGLILKAINTINEIYEKSSTGLESYVYDKVIISGDHMERGLKLYNKAIVATIGSVLEQGSTTPTKGEGEGRWIDVGGQYIPKSCVESIMDGVVDGAINSLEAIDDIFQSFAKDYQSHAYCWARWLLSGLLGRESTSDDIASAIESSKRTREELYQLALRDVAKERSISMSVSYGLDGDSEAETMADFNAVRGL